MWRHLSILFVSCCLFYVATPAMAGIQRITDDVAGEFATYRPESVTIQPAARPFTIAPDFSNISNFHQFNFTEEQKQMLLRQGFVAVPGKYLEMYDVYKECTVEAIPVFVTVDAMLHTFHEQFDFILKWTEQTRLAADLTSLTQTLLADALADEALTTGSAAREALRANISYFAVADSLLRTTETTIPALAEPLASRELALIKAQAGLSTSPLMVGTHDYSQFIPRAHYAGNELLERYFRAMMWYGLMRFSLDGRDPCISIPPEAVRRMTLQGLLITRALHRATVSTETAQAVWNRIYRPTVFFVGEADDITHETLDRLARQIYGESYCALSPDELARAERLDAFMAAVVDLPAPTIAPDFGKSFRFMGQRYIPDSEILQVTSANGMRMPKGLDVMAVLGSSRAEAILRDVYHSTPPGLGDLQTSFTQLSAATWARNLYWNWLYCLAPVLEPKGAGYPPFMQTAAWQDKDLAAALGSWTELRHDSLLYAKQSYTLGISQAMMDQGYVEPNPEAFARLLALCRYCREGLDALGLISPNINPEVTPEHLDTQFDFVGFAGKLEATEQVLLKLKTIAEKELTQSPLTFDEYMFLRHFGKTLSDLTNFRVNDGDHAFDNAYTKDLDDMAVVADVHTQLVNGEELCLEEAVGRPWRLFVIVDIAGDLRVTQGAAFSYYEFTRPSDQRLTDEAWRAMLKQAAEPDKPVWMGSYCLDGTQAVTFFEHPSYKVANMKMNVVTSPTLQSGQTLEIKLRDIMGLDSLDGARALITTASGEAFTTVTLQVDPNHMTYRDLQFFGQASTHGWPAGMYYVEGQLIKKDAPVLSYRTSFTLWAGENGVRLPWTKLE